MHHSAVPTDPRLALVYLAIAAVAGLVALALKFYENRQHQAEEQFAARHSVLDPR